MTNDNLTLLGVLVDRSGSMGRIKGDMEVGVNTLIKEQFEQDGDLLFTLAQFNNRLQTVWALGQRPSNLERAYTLQPSGGTALNDAVGKFVTDIGSYLKFLPEDNRPGTVVIVIVTDGEENSSKEYSTSQIKDLIGQQENEWNWKFVFLGNDIDSFAVGGGMGVSRGSTINFESPVFAMAATSSNIASYRTTRNADDLTYTESQRDLAGGEK